MAPATRPLCVLEAAGERSECCPREECTFWEPGGAVLPAGCLLERLGADAAGQPEVAGLLLDLQAGLERARAREEAEGVRRRLAALTTLVTFEDD